MYGFPAMAERGKDVEKYTNFYDFNYSASDIKCKKHPNPSPVGICAYCLKERLMKLLCSECEQRLSSCSCSDKSSSYRNSCSTMDIGSVGRISFLLENQKIEFRQHSVSKFLRRSSSSCVEMKKNNVFWKIKRLFRKKKHKGCVKNGESSEEIWARNSGFGGVLGAENGGIDPNRGVFTVKESDFSAMDDQSEFFDLKLDLLSESKQDLSGYAHGFQGIGYGSESFKKGGSCRITTNETGVRTGRRSHEVWKWIFKYQYDVKETK